MNIIHGGITMIELNSTYLLREKRKYTKLSGVRTTVIIDNKYAKTTIYRYLFLPTKMSGSLGCSKGGEFAGLA